MLDVVAESDPAESAGTAHLVGWHLGGPRPLATYRLTIGDDELSGLFTCVGRRFDRVPATPTRPRPPAPVRQDMHELIASVMRRPIQEMALGRLARALSKTGPVIFTGDTFEGAVAGTEWLVRRRPTWLIRRRMTTFPVYPDARTVDVPPGA
jgi:hypothetical protein